MMADMTRDFYEDDEPVDKIKSVFKKALERGLTTEPRSGVNESFIVTGTTYFGEQKVVLAGPKH